MPDQGNASPQAEPLRLFLIAGEHSGDALGGKLIEALRTLSPRPLELAGVGGELMADQGCASLFPLTELAVMSPLDILPRLPSFWRRIRQTEQRAIAFAPDALVILDSPEFTHQVARRVRRRAPAIPIIDYVSTGLGVSGLARPQHAPLHRPRARYPALRARGASPPRRPSPAALSVIRWSRSSTGSRPPPGGPA